jgi:hypothetical protein
LIVECITCYRTQQSSACIVDPVRWRVSAQVVDGCAETFPVTVPVEAPTL